MQKDIEKPVSAPFRTHSPRLAAIDPSPVPGRRPRCAALAASPELPPPSSLPAARPLIMVVSMSAALHAPAAAAAAAPQRQRARRPTAAAARPAVAWAGSRLATPADCAPRCSRRHLQQRPQRRVLGCSVHAAGSSSNAGGSGGGTVRTQCRCAVLHRAAQHPRKGPASSLASSSQPAFSCRLTIPLPAPAPDPDAAHGADPGPRGGGARARGCLVLASALGPHGLHRAVCGCFHHRLPRWLPGPRHGGLGCRWCCQLFAALCSGLLLLLLAFAVLCLGCRAGGCWLFVHFTGDAAAGRRCCGPERCCCGLVEGPSRAPCTRAG